MPGARGSKLYELYCAQCHGAKGQGVPHAYPALAGNRAVTMKSGVNLVQIVLNGGYAPATADWREIVFLVAGYQFTRFAWYRTSELADLPLWMIHIAWPTAGLTWIVFLGEQFVDEFKILFGGNA